MAARLTLRPRATSPTRRRSGRSSTTADAVVNFAAESHVDRSILDPEAFLRDRRDRRARAARGVPESPAAPAAVPPGLDRRGLRPRRDRARRRGRAARAALAVRGGQGGRRAARPELRRHPRRSTPSSPVAPTRTGRTTTPRSSSRCSSPTRSTISRCRSTATGCSGATGCTSPITPPRSTSSSATASAARPTTWRAAPSGPTATSSTLLLERLGKPWSLVREVEDRPGHDRRYAMDGAQAGGARLASRDVASRTAWRPPSTGSAPTRRGGARLGRATGTPGTSASTATGWRLAGAAATAGRRRRTPDARRRHRGGRPPRSRARRGARRRAVHRAGRADRLGPARPSTSTRRTRSARGSTATGPRSSSTRRPGPTSTAARGIRSSRSRRNGEARPASSPRPARRAAIDLWSVSTNEVFDGRRDRRPRAIAPPTTADPGTRMAPPSSRASVGRDGVPTRPAARRDLGIVRTAWLFGPPGRDFPSRILDAAERAAAAGEPLRAVADEWGTPTYVARPRRGDRGAAGGRCASPGSTTSSTGAWPVAGRLGARRRRAGRASRRRSSRCRRRPGRDLDAAALGRPRADAASVRRAAATLAGRDGRLRAGAPSRRGPGAAHEPRAAAVGAPGCPLRRRRPPRRRPGLVPRAVAAPRSTTRATGRSARFVQANLSTSAAGVLRGLHLHRRQLDYWVVASGRAFVALVDVRPLLAGRPAGRSSRRGAPAPTTGS